MTCGLGLSHMARRKQLPDLTHLYMAKESNAPKACFTLAGRHALAAEHTSPSLSTICPKILHNPPCRGSRCCDTIQNREPRITKNINLKMQLLLEPYLSSSETAAPFNQEHMDSKSSTHSTALRNEKHRLPADPTSQCQT